MGSSGKIVDVVGRWVDLSKRLSEAVALVADMDAGLDGRLAYERVR